MPRKPQAKTDQAPEALYQTCLDQMTDGLMRGSFSSFRDEIHLPHHVRTRRSACKVTTTAELRTHFDAFTASLEAQNITHYIRNTEWARYLSEDEIIGRHVTHILRQDATRLTPPYANFMTLRRGSDGKWRASELAASISNTKWPVSLPRVEPDAAQGETDY